MQLYRYRDPRGNFGDDLNDWLWPRVLPGVLDNRTTALLLGIGTLLNERVPWRPRKHVLGSGVGYGDIPVLDGTWDIRFLRGPLSCEALGLPSRTGITDPAALVRRLVPQNSGTATAVMPHHRSLQFLDWRSVCDLAGFRFIDPTGPVEQVLEDMRQSRCIIAEALHGGVVADALRIPWIPIQVYPDFFPFKWLDWMGSLGLTAEINILEPEYDGSDRPRSRRLAAQLLGRLSSPEVARNRMAEQLETVSHRESCLSNERVLDAALDRMEDVISDFRRDTGGPPAR
jgi:Polysaccharide pyruvyl transferase